MKRYKGWLWLLAVLLVFAIGMGFALFAPAPLPTEEPGARVAFNGTVIQQEEAGELVWRISAAKIEMDTKTRILYAHDVDLLFAKGAHQVHVKASEGVVDNSRKRIELSGTVDARSEDNAYLHLTNLQYDGNTNTLTADGGVVMEKGDMQLRGDRLEADRILREVRLTGNVELHKGGRTE